MHDIFAYVMEYTVCGKIEFKLYFDWLATVQCLANGLKCYKSTKSNLF